MGNELIFGRNRIEGFKKPGYFEPIVTGHQISRNTINQHTTIEFKLMVSDEDLCRSNGLSSTSIKKAFNKYCESHFPKAKKEGINKTLENLINNNRIDNNDQ